MRSSFCVRLQATLICVAIVMLIGIFCSDAKNLY